MRGNRCTISSPHTQTRSIPARAGEPFSILPSSGKPSARVGVRDINVELNAVPFFWLGNRAYEIRSVEEAR